MSNPALVALDAQISSQLKRTGWADDATFRRKNTSAGIACTVEVDDAVQFVGDQTQVADSKTLVTAYFADIGQPAPIRGDLFTVGTRKLSVDSILEQDESAVVCIVTEQKP